MPRRPSSPRLLLHLLAGASQPIFAFDIDRQLFFVNEATTGWLNVHAETLLGTTAVYDSAAVGQTMSPLQRLAPPLEVWAGEIAITELAEAKVQATERRTVAYFPLRDEAGELAGVIGIVLAAGQSLPLPEERPEALALHARLQEIHRDLGPRFSRAALLGDSPTMHRVREQVRLAGMSITRVLIQGGTGTGKEDVARAIHFDSPRGKEGLLIPLAGSLADAELVQSVVTSFLRSASGKHGPRASALWIQDVDRLPADAQMELVNLLKLPTIDVPIIATAVRSPVTLAQQGKFDPALAEALSPLVIRLPKLQTRLVDIPLLAQHFVEQWNATTKERQEQRSGFTSDALNELAGYEWPSELDELRQVVLAACEGAKASQITAADLPSYLRLASDAVAHPPKKVAVVDLDQELAALEKSLIEQALVQAKNNKTKAAQLLKINRARLLRRMSFFGLLPADEAEEAVIFEPLE